MIAECDSKLTDIIRHISVCVRDNLVHLEKQQAYQTAKNLIDDAEKLMILLSFFGIHGEQAKRLNCQSLDTELSHEAPTSAELVSSRQTQRYPSFKVNTSRPVVQGQTAILNCDIEPGIKDSSVVDFIEQNLWKSVFPRFSPESFDRQRLRDQMGQELKADDPKKKVYYLLVGLNTPEDLKSPLAGESVRDEIKRRLPELPIITLKNTSNSGFYVSSDRELMAEIFNFYQEIDGFDNKGEEHA